MLGGSIDAHELAAPKALCRLNTLLGSDALSVAKKTIEVFAGSNKTFLDQDHFEVFLQHLAKTTHCSFHIVCLLLVTRLAFTEILRYTARMTDDPSRAKRIKFRFSKDFDNYETIDYPGFCEFVKKLSDTNATDFHDIINSIALGVGRQVATDKDAREVFTDTSAYEKALHSEVAAVSENDAILLYGKMERLYDLLDSDHDGSLDISEVALFVRRFQRDKDIDRTISESIHAMFAADTNGDNRLDKT
jgi:hypothetical protein